MVNGVACVLKPGPLTVDVEDGEVTFTVRSVAGEGELVLPVVYVEDEDEQALTIDGDGEPTVGFGVGGVNGFVDVHELYVDTAVDNVIDPTSGALDGFQAPEGTEFEFDVTLASGDLGNDGIAVAVDGQEVDYRILDAGDADTAMEWADIPADAIAFSGFQ